MDKHLQTAAIFSHYLLVGGPSQPFIHYQYQLTKDTSTCV
jgi:hypothetical protein